MCVMQNNNAHTAPLYKINKILSFNDLFKLQCVKIMYKKTQGTLHAYHTNQLTETSSGNDIQTRQKWDIKLKEINKFLEINSLNLKIGRSWNALPFSIKDNKFKTIDSFTKHVKELYLSQYKNECLIPNCYICNL